MRPEQGDKNRCYFSKISAERKSTGAGRTPMLGLDSVYTVPQPRKQPLQETRLARAEEQHGGADAVLNPAGRGAQKHVAQQAVTVGAHGKQVAFALLDP